MDHTKSYTGEDKIILIKVGARYLVTLLWGCSFLLFSGVGIFSMFNSISQAAQITHAAITIDGVSFGYGKTWHVGPTRTYDKPSAVASLVQNGDIIEIDHAVYTCDAGVKWKANDLILRGVGGRPIIDNSGCQIPGGKGTWTPRGTNLLIENMEFVGAKVSSNNGAGIRPEGSAQGLYVIRDSIFRKNENGILFTIDPILGDVTELIIERSEFDSNGYADGRSHNMYISRIKSFTLKNSYSHDAISGHLVKTVAKKNYILFNRLTDEAGTSSYTIEITGGGPTYIIGNIIQQGSVSENSGIMSYAAESRKAARNNPDKRLYIAHNTVVNDHASSHVSFLNLFDYAGDLGKAVIVNNLFVDVPAGRLIDNKHSTPASKIFNVNNIETTKPELVNKNGFGYFLLPTSPAIDTAVDANQYMDDYALVPEEQYIHPIFFQTRTQIGSAMDVGAYEYDGTVPKIPSVEFSASSTNIKFDASVVLTWSSTDNDSCVASGHWTGTRPSTGSEVVSGLQANKQYILTCFGKGGDSSRQINITVGLNSKLGNYPTYEWEFLPGTDFNSLCTEGPPISGPSDCRALDGWISATYVPTNNSYYFFGGAGRSYWGNPVFALDLDTKTVRKVFAPTNLLQTVNLQPLWETETWAKLKPCTGVLDLFDGSVAPVGKIAYGSWIYIPSVDKIYMHSGRPNYGSSCLDDDGWYFDPETNEFELLYRSSNGDKGVHGAYDPVTSTVLMGSNKGINSFDPSSISLTSLVGKTTRTWAASSVLDSVNRLWLMIGSGSYNPDSFAVVDISTLPGPVPSAEYVINKTRRTGWTLKGDYERLIAKDTPGLAYDSDNGNILAWAGTEDFYFIELDKTNKIAHFIRMPIPNGPKFEDRIGSSFHYIPSKKMFVVYEGATKGFWLLKEKVAAP